MNAFAWFLIGVWVGVAVLFVATLVYIWRDSR